MNKLFIASIFIVVLFEGCSYKDNCPSCYSSSYYYKGCCGNSYSEYKPIPLSCCY